MLLGQGLHDLRRAEAQRHGDAGRARALQAARGDGDGARRVPRPHRVDHEPAAQRRQDRRKVPRCRAARHRRARGDAPRHLLCRVHRHAPPRRPRVRARGGRRDRSRAPPRSAHLRRDLPAVPHSHAALPVRAFGRQQVPLLAAAAHRGRPGGALGSAAARRPTGDQQRPLGLQLCGRRRRLQDGGWGEHALQQGADGAARPRVPHAAARVGLPARAARQPAAGGAPRLRDAGAPLRAIPAQGRARGRIGRGRGAVGFGSEGQDHKRGAPRRARLHAVRGDGGARRGPPHDPARPHCL
mmetsp:Transcript_35041/g.110484  ORF Transcript_35041/g.110484 Transcript_35041/m.110484 type:complete len:298 (+) Transcript_35041:506-1399(+)